MLFMSNLINMSSSTLYEECLQSDGYNCDTSTSSNKSIDAEHVVVAVTFISVSILYLIPYITCMYIIYTDKKMSRQAYYTIVQHMGIADVNQLVLNGIVGGLFTIFNIDFALGGWRLWLNKIAGT